MQALRNRVGLHLAHGHRAQSEDATKETTARAEISPSSLTWTLMPARGMPRRCRRGRASGGVPTRRRWKTDVQTLDKAARFRAPAVVTERTRVVRRQETRRRPRRTYSQSMPGDLHYAHEKFATARYQLAIGDGTLRERFLRAYLDQAHHALPLRSGLGPPISQELADDLNSFGDDMSRRSAVAGEGTIAATVAALTDDELHDAVARFLALASDLDREYYRS